MDSIEPMARISGNLRWKKDLWEIKIAYESHTSGSLNGYNPRTDVHTDCRSEPNCQHRSSPKSNFAILYHLKRCIDSAVAGYIIPSSAVSHTNTDTNAGAKFSNILTIVGYLQRFLGAYVAHFDCDRGVVRGERRSRNTGVVVVEKDIEF